MTEERIFVFEDRVNKKVYRLSYRGMIAMVFVAEMLGIWYRVSEITNGDEVPLFMKVSGETIEMYDINENLLSVSTI